MKIVKVVAFLCASVALAGCSGKGETYHCGDVERIDAFPYEYNLGETKPLDIDLTGAVNVFAADSLMVSEYLSGPFFWKVYSLQTRKWLGSMLRSGHGKGEVVQLPSDGCPMIQGGQLMCDLWMAESQTWGRVNLTKSIANRSTVWEDNVKIPLDGTFLDVFRLDDSSFFSVRLAGNGRRERGVIKDGRFVMLDQLGTLNTLGTDDEYNTLSSVVRLNPQRDRVVEAMIRLNELVIYSLRTNFRKTLSMGDDLQDVKTVSSKPRWFQRKSFGYLSAYKDFFGVLYYDCSMKDYQSDKAGKTDLLFFDWNGAPLARIRIPYQATSFFIYGNSLYVFTSVGEKEHLYQYALPRIN